MTVVLAAVILLQTATPEQLVEKLRSDTIEEREAAARGLRTLEEAALPALDKAARDSDVNLARAAAELSKEIRARVDGRAAEKAFRAIEEALLQARTLKVAIHLVVTEGRRPGEPFSATCDCWIKGDKVYLRACVPSKEKDSELICNGARMATIRNGDARSVEEGWPNSGDRFKVGLLRVGIYAVDHILKKRQGAKLEGEADLRKVLEVSDFKTGADEGNAKTIVFRTTAPGGRETTNVTVLYDPRTFRILRRSCSNVVDGVEKAVVVETYTDVALDAEMPDDRFTLPEKQK